MNEVGGRCTNGMYGRVSVPSPARPVPTNLFRKSGQGVVSKGLSFFKKKFKK